MIELRSWRERLAAAGGTLPERIRYTRKSTEGDERQVASHDQQSVEADKNWGVIAPSWWWKDSCSGTSFDRPAFKDMLTFCREHPRSKKAPGRVELFDPSRFGRTLDEDGQPDVGEFQRVYQEFERCGWRIDFVTLPRAADKMVDVMQIIIHSYAAAQYSTTLSRNVRRGRVSHATSGWWTGGSAPWGTKRMDTKSGRVLSSGEPSTPGGGGTILVPDKSQLKWWKHAAKRIMGGASLDSVGKDLYDRGLRGPRGGHMGHRSVRNFLTNSVLVGMVGFLDEAPKGGTRARRQVKAKWDPMVDVETFAEVTKRLNGHSRRPQGGRRRRRRELFPLQLRCAHCGSEYVAGRLAEAQGGDRGYVHAKPKARMDEEGRKRFDEAGCKVWYVDAEEIEVKVKDLIVRQRSSKTFEDEMRSLILERDTFRQAAGEAIEQAKRDVARRKMALDRLKVMAGKLVATAMEGQSDDDLVEQLTEAKQHLRQAEATLLQAETFAQSRASAWQRLSSIISETRSLAAAWNKGGPEGRKVMLDYWVLDALIVVDPVPGKRRANLKTALITLRTAPNSPVPFGLGPDGGSRQESPAPSRSSTAGSGSKGMRARIASRAASERMQPSAAAACARTSGSGSASADVSAGTSSSVPTLPKTDEALRLRPASLARERGVCRNEDANASCVSASTDRESVRGSELDSPGMGANAGSVASRECLWFHGQTSWQMSHPNRCSATIAACSDVCAPLSSMVRYEMHRRASSTRGATNAWVGHASRQRVQLPQ